MNKEKLQAAIRMMITTDRMHKRLFDTKLCDLGIHRSAHMILINIHKNGGIGSQKQLANIVGITPAAVTGALKTLEKKGYITRTLGRDTRYNEVNVTEAGALLLASAKSMFTEVDETLFEGFTEGEFDMYISCLNKMQNNIEKQLEKNRGENS